ncbi:MAG: hypothetical protein HY704_15395 [Gemmatimonadetes bacterium]|nr:hypothetical protein [Gemmatimonadota bacterium]
MLSRVLSRALVALALALPACRLEQELGPSDRPLIIDLSADRSTARPGEEIAFQVQASGAYLAGIIINYADGQVDSVATGGARTASVRTRHAYTKAGTYVVRAIAEELSGSNAFDDVSVQISPP